MNKLQSLSIFVLAALACGTLPAQSPASAPPDLSGMTDAYLAQIEQRDLSARHAEIAAIHTAAGVKERQAYIRKTLLRELGGFPDRTPLHAEITGTIDNPDYTVQKLVYQSLPHFYVTANVYVPKHAKKPYPAVLGLAGHGIDGKSFKTYQTVWASLARRGILVLAIDPIGQGERLEHLDSKTHRSLIPVITSEHMADGLQTLLTGTSIARYFIWDGIRGIDYLESRDDVDKAHIGTAGNSGGGTQSAYIATMDQRVTAAVISCYMTSWNAMWADPGPQDSEQVFTDFLADHLDFPDFLTRIAPHPALMEVATQDFFPIQGAHDTFTEAKRMFSLLGVSDHVALFEYNDTHGWSAPRRAAAYKWFSRWFLNKEDDRHEAAVTLNTDAELAASPKGQVVLSYPDAQTVQSLNAEQAKRLRQQKPAPKGIKQLAVLVRKRLRLDQQKINPSTDKLGSYTQGSAEVEKIQLHPEPGITLPGLVFTPANGPARKHAILYLNPAGVTADAAPGGPIDHLVKEGNIVLAIDPRGWGASAPPKKLVSGYKTDYQMSMHALLVGKTIPGMQTFDVLNAFHYLEKRPDVDANQIALHTQGIATNLGIYAAVLDPHINGVVADKAPLTFLQITELKLNNVSPEVIVPGVLQDFDLPDLIRALGPRFRVSQ
ncbi:MAG TPA: acetylxylan esterase [Edaphobacter sp.]|nr:acetylxylan esterase [Edaphobacter sp.]